MADYSICGGRLKQIPKRLEFLCVLQALHELFITISIAIAIYKNQNPQSIIIRLYINTGKLQVLLKSFK